MSKIKHLNKNKLKDLTLRTLSALSISFVIASIQLPKKDDSIVYNQESDISYSNNTNTLWCGKYGGNLELSNYTNNNEINDNIEVFINGNQLITDLSKIEKIYHKITKLTIVNCSSIINLSQIYNCSSIINLSQIYNMSNLEEVDINECPGVNKELVNYLNENNIKHNITYEDIKNSEKLDEILKITINNSMDDSDKIKAITNYIVDNYSYDLDYTVESNNYPLTCILKNKKGVCASYAYLANALFRKANINSFELISKNHAWNVVELDKKYYYIDSTNIDNNMDYFLFKKFNISLNYLTNPGENLSTLMENYDAGSDKILINQDLINKIKNGEEYKNILEKNPLFIAKWLMYYLICTLSIADIYIIVKIVKMKKEDKLNGEISREHNKIKRIRQSHKNFT